MTDTQLPEDQLAIALHLGDEPAYIVDEADAEVVDAEPTEQKGDD